MDFKIGDRMWVAGLKSGTKLGLLAGLAVTFFTLFAAALLKGLITNFTGIWPDDFHYGHVVNFILSGWWILIVMVLCPVGGAVVGVLTRRRYELL